MDSEGRGEKLARLVKHRSTDDLRPSSASNLSTVTSTSSSAAATAGDSVATESGQNDSNLLSMRRVSHSAGNLPTSYSVVTDERQLDARHTSTDENRQQGEGTQRRIVTIVLSGAVFVFVCVYLNLNYCSKR